MLGVPGSDDTASSRSGMGRRKSFTGAGRRSRRSSLVEDDEDANTRTAELEMFRASLVADGPPVETEDDSPAGLGGRSGSNRKLSFRAGADDDDFIQTAAGPVRKHSGNLASDRDVDGASSRDHAAHSHAGRGPRKSMSRSANPGTAGDMVSTRFHIDELKAPTTAVSGGPSHGPGRSSQQRATQLDDQLFGNQTLLQAASSGDGMWIARNVNGTTVLVHEDDATFCERLVAGITRCRLTLTVRLSATALVLCLGGLLVGMFIILRVRDGHFAYYGKHYTEGHVKAVTECALRTANQVSTIAISRATDVLDTATLDIAAADRCDIDAVRDASVARASDSISSVRAIDTDETGAAYMAASVAEAFDAVAAFDTVALTTAQQGEASASVTEQEVRDFAAASRRLFQSYKQLISARLGFEAAVHATDAINVAALLLTAAETVVDAMVYGAFASRPDINVTAGDPIANNGWALENPPVRTGYVEAVQHLQRQSLFDFGFIAPPALPAASVLGAVAAFHDLRSVLGNASLSTAATSATLLSNDTSARGRAAQALGWAEQLLSTPTASTELPAAWIVFVAAAAIIVVFMCIIAATMIVAYRAQLRRRTSLRRQLDQRYILQQAVAAFVPRHFLSLMGYENITAIRAGDHRMVTLTMVFYSVHNYNALGAGSKVDRMFRFQQNLMATCVDVTTNNDGFIDKFMGDGAFLLFSNGIDAVIASAELYQCSEDLAVRQVQHARPLGRQLSESDQSFRSQSQSVRSANTDRKSNARGAYGDVPTIESDGDSEGSIDYEAEQQAKDAVVEQREVVVFNRRKDKHKPGAAVVDRRKSLAAAPHRHESMTEMGESHRSNGTRVSSGQAVIDEADRVRIGIGIHTGEVCVGILGDRQRHSCTLISSKVNLASRLCKLTQKLRVGILVSQDTYESCGQELEEEVGHYLRRFGSTIVYGQKKPTEVLELFACDPPEIRDFKLSTAPKWAEALELQQYMRYEDAGALFAEIKEECDQVIPRDQKGVDGRPFLDVPLDLNKKLRQKHHVFLEK